MENAQPIYFLFLVFKWNRIPAPHIDKGIISSHNKGIPESVWGRYIVIEIVYFCYTAKAGFFFLFFCWSCICLIDILNFSFLSFRVRDELLKELQNYNWNIFCVCHKKRRKHNQHFKILFSKINLHSHIKPNIYR